MQSQAVHERAPLRTCAVTGTSGYVGSKIAGRLAAQGWAVRAFTRTSPSERHLHLTHAHFDLGEGPPAPAAFEDVDALVHAAYDFHTTGWPEIERVNVEGSRNLFAAAHDAGVRRIVLVSTVAAFPEARSLYGRAKLED